MFSQTEFGETYNKVRHHAFFCTHARHTEYNAFLRGLSKYFILKLCYLTTIGHKKAVTFRSGKDTQFNTTIIMVRILLMELMSFLKHQ